MKSVLTPPLESGHLTCGVFNQGESSDGADIMPCHPSLCNDNLSGIALAVLLAKHLSQLSLRYSYHFSLFLIGLHTWLCYQTQVLNQNGLDMCRRFRQVYLQKSAVVMRRSTKLLLMS